MSLQGHNARELEMIRQLYRNTAWLMSERAGSDLTLTAEGRAAIQKEMADIIALGMGAWMAAQVRSDETQKPL